jgi:hypothetical protein
MNHDEYGYRRHLAMELARQTIETYINSLKSISPAARLSYARKHVMNWSKQWEKDNPPPSIMRASAGLQGFQPTNMQ